MSSCTAATSNIAATIDLTPSMQCENDANGDNSYSSPTQLTLASAASTSSSSACYSLHYSGRLWQITQEMRRQLISSGCWTCTRDQSSSHSSLGLPPSPPSYHLLLGDRGRIQFGQLTGRMIPTVPERFEKCYESVAEVQPTRVLVNYYRGCNELTNKSALCKTMRRFATTRNLSPEQLAYLPLTFVLRPGAVASPSPSAADPASNFTTVADERIAFHAEFQRRQQLLPTASTQQSNNIWIAKANRGAKGESIFVSDKYDEIIAYIDAQGQEVNEKPTDDSFASGPTSPTSLNATATTTPTAASSPTTLSTPFADSLPPIHPNGISATSSTIPTASASIKRSLSSRAPPLRSRSRTSSISSSFSSSSTSSPLSSSSSSNSWVVQQYITHPFLIKQRKFDIRCWVLCDSQYRIYLYRTGVCRTSSTLFNLSDLNNRFIHLTNHCIQETHPDFSKGEEGNELFFDRFQEYLDSLPESTLHPRLCLRCHLLPQLHAIIHDTFSAVRDSMECLPNTYSSYQLFGYDFMLDERFRVSLLEINATPATAEVLLEKMVRDLIETAVEPVFRTRMPADSSTATTSSPAAAATSSPPSSTTDEILFRPCHCDSLRNGRTRQEYFRSTTDVKENLFDRIG